MPTSHQHSGHSRGRRRKNELRKLLLEHDWTHIQHWADNNSNAFGTLSSLFFDPDRLVVWRAIDAIGRISATSDREKVVLALRRLFWLMNDESGGISWHAPEAIAEVLGAVPDLIAEFGQLYLSFIVEEPFEAGVCWGIRRLCELNRPNDEMREIIRKRRNVILRYLQSDDARLRGYATLAAAGLKIPVEHDIKSRLTSDQQQIEIYDFASGELRMSPIALLAESLTTN